tara:strand:- start:327 stop:590 length:264 start_codon:yes stop_codon:yes gene_type:complete
MSIADFRAAFVGEMESAPVGDWLDIRIKYHKIALYLTREGRGMLDCRSWGMVPLYGDFMQISKAVDMARLLNDTDHDIKEDLQSRLQ